MTLLQKCKNIHLLDINTKMLNRDSKSYRTSLKVVIKNLTHQGGAFTFYLTKIVNIYRILCDIFMNITLGC